MDETTNSYSGKRQIMDMLDATDDDGSAKAGCFGPRQIVPGLEKLADAFGDKEPAPEYMCILQEITRALAKASAYTDILLESQGVRL